MDRIRKTNPGDPQGMILLKRERGASLVLTSQVG